MSRSSSRAASSILFVASCVAAAIGTPVTSDNWTKAAPGYEWSFPGDHAPHFDYSIEWWYFTGHLQTEGGSPPRFGYQFTFFRVGLDPTPPGPATSDATSVDTTPVASRFRARDAIMGHAAITDFEQNTHLFSEVFYRASPLFGEFAQSVSDEAPIAWSLPPTGTEERWKLAWNGAGFDFAFSDERQGIALDLATEPTRPTVFHGDHGFSAKSANASAASLYYSFTRLDTHGTVRVGDETYSVTGTSWMDREFSTSQLNEKQVGWDWFSLHLDDGRDVMLYLLRRGDGSIDYARGTLVESDGSSRPIDRNDFELRPTSNWLSEASGARYPSRWRLTMKEGAIDVEIATRIPDQENRSHLVERLFYYEGSVRVLANGVDVGRGYVELTGYGDDARLPL